MLLDVNQPWQQDPSDQAMSVMLDKGLLSKTASQALRRVGFCALHSVSRNI